jgi:hypothetical protein
VEGFFYCRQSGASRSNPIPGEFIYFEKETAMDKQSATTTGQAVGLQVTGFTGFEARPMADGSISFSGSVKIGSGRYFASIKVTAREDGSPSIKLGDYRFETFTGKPVRGSANIKLEDLMDSAKDVALAWAANHYGAALPA